MKKEDIWIFLTNCLNGARIFKDTIANIAAMTFYEGSYYYPNNLGNLLIGNLTEISGTGTVTISAGGTTINGSGTKFLTQLYPGTLVKVDNNETRMIKDVTSDTVASVYSAFVNAYSAKTFKAYRTSRFLDTANRTMIQVTRSTAQTLTHAVWAKIQLGTVIYDRNGEYDAATNYRFTAARAGLYLIIGTINYLSNAAGTRIAQIQLNGANIGQAFWGSPALATATYVQTLGLVFMDIGDYIELWGYQNCGGNLNVQYCQMDIIEV